MPTAERTKRKTDVEIGKKILTALEKGGIMSVSSIRKATKINWGTIDKHLEYLRGVGLVERIDESSGLKLFRLVPKS